jgi:hypothetical protein
MTLYEKDTSFSVGWMFGGAVIMFFLNLFAGLGLALSGITPSLWLYSGVGAGCFALGGFIVGRASAGRTILEAGLAAMLATTVTVVMSSLRGRTSVEPLAIAILSLPPFVCGTIGGYIGEKVQGDTVEVQD